MNARDELARAFGRNYGEGGLPEACDDVNDASRAAVAALAQQHGSAWLGRINGKDSDPVLSKWDGGLVCNFAADFALPASDDEIAGLILEHRTAPWRNRDAYLRIACIYERVRALGGVVLVWS